MSSTPDLMSLDQNTSPSYKGFLNRLSGRANSYALPFWGTLIVVVIVYVIFLLDTHSNLAPTSTPYYNYLLSAFLHGRTDITPPGTYDLSRYAGKWYLYWGPSPVLFILPFYAFSHLQTSDVLYGFVSGVLNVVVFSGCVTEVVRYFKLNVGRLTKAFIVLNFAFISPNFYLAMGGTIWYINQLVAIFYLLLFYYFYFHFLNTKRLPSFAVSVAFFCLAWNARPSLIFNAVLFVYLFVVLFQNDRALLRKVLGITTLAAFVSVAAFLWYNEIRFSNPFEIGYRFQGQAAAPRFAKDYATGQEFSLLHIPHNATYYFLNHISLRFEKPYLQYDQEGNSIFSVYPLTILAFYLFRKSIYTRKNGLFLLLFLSGLAINFLIVLMSMGTGWVEFGSRYFLDVVPGLFLAILFVVDRVGAPVRTGILLYGMYVNFLGTLAYYQPHPTGGSTPVIDTRAATDSILTSFHSRFHQAHPNETPPHDLALTLDKSVLFLADQQPAARYAPGDEVRIPLYLYVLNPPQHGYLLSARLTDASGKVWEKSDKVLWATADTSLDGTSTTKLVAGNYVQDSLSVKLDPGLPPGTYSLDVLAFDIPSFDRLSLTNPTGKSFDQIERGKVVIASARDLGTAASLVPSHPLRADSEDGVSMLGYDVHAGASAAGDLQVSLYWLARSHPARDYTVFVQLLDASGRVVAQSDSYPLGGHFPTSQLRPGDVLRDTHDLKLPPGLATGTYRLIAGMYRLDTMQRLSFTPGDGGGAMDHLELGTISPSGLH